MCAILYISQNRNNLSFMYSYNTRHTNSVPVTEYVIYQINIVLVHFRTYITIYISLYYNLITIE